MLVDSFNLDGGKNISIFSVIGLSITFKTLLNWKGFTLLIGKKITNQELVEAGSVLYNLSLKVQNETID